MIRIAAEEAWAPSDLLERYRKLLAEKPASWDPGFHSLWGFFLGAKPRATALVRRIQDLGEQRLADMDASGIAKQLVFLTAPGVQVFDAPTAVSLARECNDRLVDNGKSTSRPIRGARRHRAAGSGGGGEGAAARGRPRNERSSGQLAYARQLSRRAAVLGDLRGGAGARRADLPASQHAAAGNDRALPAARARRRGLPLP